MSFMQVIKSPLTDNPKFPQRVCHGLSSCSYSNCHVLFPIHANHPHSMVPKRCFYPPQTWFMGGVFLGIAHPRKSPRWWLGAKDFLLWVLTLGWHLTTCDGEHGEPCNVEINSLKNHSWIGPIWTLRPNLDAAEEHECCVRVCKFWSELKTS